MKRKDSQTLRYKLKNKFKSDFFKTKKVLYISEIDFSLLF